MKHIYIFRSEQSFVSEINNFKNIVVLQTFSKAWGLAGLRVGLAFANAEIIELFNKVKPPYNVSEIAQEAVLKHWKIKKRLKIQLPKSSDEREKLIVNLSELSKS